MTENWQTRVSAVWARASELADLDLLAEIDALVAERPEDDAAAVFEAAGARNYLGQEAEAEPLYRRALELGLDERRRPQAVIQLASTLRNLGEVRESISLLERQLHEHPGDEWTGPTAAFLSLALVSRGDEREAAAVALAALADYLPMYSRSVRGYATALVDS
jgi:tetratricopeptide (TPR) repeat protein